MRVIISSFRDQTAFVLQVKRLRPEDRPNRLYAKALSSLARVVGARRQTRKGLRSGSERAHAMREDRAR